MIALKVGYTQRNVKKNGEIKLMVRSDSKLALSVMEQHHYGGEYYDDEIEECPECGWYKPDKLYYSHKNNDYVAYNGTNRFR